MTKEEKKQEAYGGLIDLNLLDENGWAIYGCEDFSESGIEPFGEYETKNHIAGVYNWRPKSLQGIENNNGWIKIESEKDLPKVTADYYIIHEGSINVYSDADKEDFKLWLGIYSHYQPIIKPDLPLY